MSTRILFAALIALLAATAQAQFVGDSLAAAGYATMSQPQSSGLSSIGPREVQMVSPQVSNNLTPIAQPNALPAAVSPQPVATASTTSSPGVNISSTEMQPSGYAFSGGGKVYSPEEAAAWKAAFVPVGTTVTAPPAEAETVTGSWGSYAYSKGVFYKKQGEKWVAVAAPAGARVKDRPAGASMIVHDNAPYLYYNGAFFVWNSAANAAEVVAAPAGAVVSYIPETAAKKDKCYVYGETCFKATFRGTAVVYVVG